MNRARAILNKHAPTLAALALVLCALGFFWPYRDDPAKAQTVGALFSFFAAAILVGVTWEYVRINQKILSLQQAQWEDQNRVVIRFGIRRNRGRAQLWVANLGKTDFLISQLQVRRKYNEKKIVNQRRVVASGSRSILALPKELWAEISLISAFDVQLHYESQRDSGVTPARAFTLVIGQNSEVLKVLRGIEDTWFVACPKCKDVAGSMITENLEDFDAALERQQVMESELNVTCPDHSSQWSDTVEQIRERRKNQIEPAPED
jgi:hypothetical protein